MLNQIIDFLSLVFLMPNFSFFFDLFQLIFYPSISIVLIVFIIISFFGGGKGLKIARDILIAAGAGTTAYVNMGGQPPRRNNDEDKEREEAEAKQREEEAEQQRLETERRLAEQSEATKELNERVAKLEKAASSSSK